MEAPPVFTLFDRIRYKLSLKKEIDASNKIIAQLESDSKELDEAIYKINELNNSKICILENLNDPEKSLNLNLVSKEIKPTLLNRFIRHIFKHDGYILYINKADELKIFKVNNFKTIYDLNSIESYGLNKCIGSYNGKPIFMVKYPYAMSLDIGKNTLSYDAPTFYNYVNKVTKANLTNWGSSLGLGDFIKKNFLIIIIAIIAIILLTTPQGKEFISNIIPSSRPG